MRRTNFCGKTVLKERENGCYKAIALCGDSTLFIIIYVHPSRHTASKWRRINVDATWSSKWRRFNVDATWSRRIDVDTTSFWRCVPTGILIFLTLTTLWSDSADDKLVTFQNVVCWNFYPACKVLIGGGWVVQRCHVSYVTGASNGYWLTVGQGLLSL